MQEDIRRAQMKVRRMKKFYKRLSSWMLTSIFLMFLFTFLKLPPWITLIVVGSWGLSIASEAIEVFGMPGFSKDWEERKLREELENMGYRDMPDQQPHDEGDDILELPERSKVTRQWRDTDLV